MNFSSEKIGWALVLLVGLATLSSFFLMDPVPQDIQYHAFSDKQAYFLIPNAFNVLSNIPFLIVGVVGLLVLASKQSESISIVESNRLAYIILFAGITFVALGSGYYHLWPNNVTLVWDRLPMTLAFMALYSIIISEFVSEKIGRLLLIPFLCTGVASVFYWWFTESRGVGDLRFYAMVQFFPMLTIPIMLLFFKPKFSLVSGYWILMACYFAAKLFEHFDSQIHDALIYVSGHSIKHVLPVIGLFILLKSYKNREEIEKTIE